MEQGIAAMIADTQMRKRDERLHGQVKYKVKADPLHDKQAASNDIMIKLYKPQDFKFNENGTATCPAGNAPHSSGTTHTTARGLHYKLYAAKLEDCQERSRKQARQIRTLTKKDKEKHAKTFKFDVQLKNDRK